MARRRRRFVGALVVDGIATSYLVLAALLHSTSSQRSDHIDDVPEMAPFLGHLGHGFIALLGLGGIWLPGSSFFARVLRVVAILSFFGDAVSVALHVTTLNSADRLLDECAVYAILAILLTLSSLNVYWTSGGELSTFDIIDHVERQQRQR